MTSHEQPEHWQVFGQSGEPLGTSIVAGMNEPSLTLGHAHVWLWRDSERAREILIQRRALSGVRYAGMWDISAAGHVNYLEKPIDAAVREAYEELGVTLQADNLYLVQVRRSLATGAFQWIYLCRLDGDTELLPNEQEVSEVKWVSIDQFRAITEQPEAYSQLDKGEEYFCALLAELEAAK